MVIIGRDIALPVNKDILIVAGQMHRLSGVVVYAPKAGQGAGKVFVPRDAAEIIRMHGGP